ncbi:MAG: L-erythro-3,5-diaminohexanoate dehydrogenase [Clostridiales bacterium]|jgi:L-erythro-3,5-diaminohexanoate dehydrogenase|nr:L-erythro-3,5-diaminohexanoate dehydrogenase [Clostridiales bacterium]
MEKQLCKYGTYRVMEPLGVLPQTAQKIDNTMEITDNEILIDVISLNIDSASFAQLKEEADGDEGKIAAKIMEIVAERGKMQNPVTGSGGMLIGKIARVGKNLEDHGLAAGDKIATLVSLSLTPLKIEKINAIQMDIDRVDVTAQAILFETGIYAKLPDDMTQELALAALDVAGAPAQTAKLVKPGDSVLILGAGGKSGMLCCYEAMRRVGPTGNVVACVRNDSDRDKLLDNSLAHAVIISDVTRPIEMMDMALAANGGREFDISINCVNVPNSEMASILPVRDGGTVYFFSMAVSFTKAALGAEGVGKDVNMIIGNGYSRGHAEITLGLLRESEALRRIFEERYV